MKFNAGLSLAAFGIAVSATGVQAQSFTEGFNDASLPTGWIATNLSTRNSTGFPWQTTTAIVDADDTVVVSPYEGAGFAVASYQSIGSGTGTINNWLISPVITGLKNGDKFSFFTTTVPDSDFADRMEFRLSAGAGSDVGTTVTSVGTFTTLLQSINTDQAVPGYPESWTQYNVTLTDLAAPTSGRVAFRYFVTSGGPTGVNSNIIGVDQFSYVAAAVPEPATWALSLAGLVGVAGLVRTRRHQAA